MLPDWFILLSPLLVGFAEFAASGITHNLVTEHLYKRPLTKEEDIIANMYTGIYSCFVSLVLLATLAWLYEAFVLGALVKWVSRILIAICVVTIVVILLNINKLVVLSEFEPDRGMKIGRFRINLRNRITVIRIAVFLVSAALAVFVFLASKTGVSSSVG